MQTLFITGIGTDVGKTLVAAILAEALEADYWKPVQAGYDGGTDSEWVKNIISNSKTTVHPETYKFRLAASPHIAAREEGLRIELDQIESRFKMIRRANDRTLIIEGAGGLMVPLNHDEFVIDLVKKIGAIVVIVSRNYLGSINHSLMTASICNANQIPVAGWIFNDQYLDYEDEIVRWSNIPSIGSVPLLPILNKKIIVEQANLIGPKIKKLLQI